MRVFGVFALLCCWNCVIWSLGNSAAHAQSPFRVVARTGQAAPGADGLVFAGNWLHVPKLNDSGEVLFAAYLAPPGQSISGSGLWKWDGDQLAAVIRSGQPMPGTPTLNEYGSADSYDLAQDGSLGLLATVYDPQAMASRHANWHGQPAGLQFAVADDENIDSPAGPVRVNSIINSEPGPQIANAENIVFTVQFVRPNGPVSGSNIAIVRKGPAGVAAFAMVQEPAPGIPDNVVFDGLWQVGVNAAGAATFNGRLDGAATPDFTERGVWVNDAAGTRLLLRSNEPAPGLPGILLRDIEATRPLDVNGRLLFTSTLAGASVSSGGDTSIWIRTHDTLQLVVREGESVPGAPNGVRFSDMESDLRQSNMKPDLSSGGHVAFAVRINGPGITTSNDQGVWAWDGATKLPIAREGDQAPGSPQGFVFAQFVGPEINGHGQVAFPATLQGPGVVGSNDNGIWATDRDGQLQLIAREGQQITLPGGEVATIDRLAFGARPVAINDRGEIAFYATFTNAPAAILVSTAVAVPEPTGGTLAMIAGFILAALPAYQRLRAA